jgi:hypothetical protein
VPRHKLPTAGRELPHGTKVVAKDLFLKPSLELHRKKITERFWQGFLDGLSLGYLGQECGKTDQNSDFLKIFA